MTALLRLFARIYLFVLSRRAPEKLAAGTPPAASPFRSDTNYPFY
jgi:hypothetical protein